jgi:phosphomevalonate kinase
MIKLASRNLPPTRASLASLPPFQSTGTTLKDVHKTGLGSSAALITSLVTALLVHTGIIPRSVLSAGPSNTSNTQEDETVQARRLAHNLAQHVHCLAQGKVGSGFDVSAAVFGSQLYTRFSPDVLEPLMMDELVSNK